MTNAKTTALMNEIVSHARTGAKVYPFMFQPRMGVSNTVSAAIRAAKKLGLIEEGGKDGVGKPYYVAKLPQATHEAPASIN
jgi:hypothetical protein